VFIAIDGEHATAYGPFDSEQDSVVWAYNKWEYETNQPPVVPTYLDVAEFMINRGWAFYEVEHVDLERRPPVMLWHNWLEAELYSKAINGGRQLFHPTAH